MHRYNFKWISAIIVISISLMASYCGEDAYNSKTGNGVTIDTYAITGNYTDSTDGLEVIDGSGTGSNDILLTWDVTTTHTYTFEVKLSADDVLDASDVLFFSGTCGYALACGASGDFTCSFDKSTVQISCNGGTAIDVTSVLNAIAPQSAYIFLKVTNESMTNTASEGQQVKFDGY